MYSSCRHDTSLLVDEHIDSTSLVDDLLHGSLAALFVVDVELNQLGSSGCPSPGTSEGARRVEYGSSQACSGAGQATSSNTHLQVLPWPPCVVPWHTPCILSVSVIGVHRVRDYELADVEAHTDGARSQLTHRQEFPTQSIAGTGKR